jgi:serine/threonine protein kinase
MELSAKRWQARLCDFGISMPHSAEHMGVKVFKPSILSGVSLRYASPERLRAFFNQSTCETKYEPDVYAFGCVLWDCMHWTFVWKDLDTVKLKERVLAGDRPEIDGSISTQHPLLADCMRKCWTQDYTLRPSMEDVLQVLAERQ